MSKAVIRIPRSDADWIYTASGKKVWPLDPRPEEIDIEDIAHALARVCRFTGHCEPFYSVAEHSERVSRQAEEQARGQKLDKDEIRQTALWGLLHDASEAYICDLSRPMKGSRQIGKPYSGFEAGLMQAITERFGLPWRMPLPVRYADEILLATEFRDLMRRCEIPGSLKGIAPLPETIVPYADPYEAQKRFLARFCELTDREG